ncbi:Hypothetical predicted protein [Pelobates cultripes]|uniref:UBZ1-type domain-containing protein n=1 Tax=Pelobates cultripes TaxID=61616 RepID=A0AAD1WCJ7_PELCU|nr:Hypothetical predicted protein [Pelobates cultripes]
MDKNIGDQLNKAFEAYRHVCMENQRIKKDMNSKIELCEQQLQDRDQEIVKLRGVIADLTAQLPKHIGTGCHGPPPSPKVENAEVWGNTSASDVSYEQLQEELRISMHQKIHYKEQLENEQLRLRKMYEEQKKLESLVFSKNDEIRVLKNLLKDAKEREKHDYKAIPAHELEMRIKKTSQESAALGTSLDDNARQNVERVFCDLKNEFRQICKLTKEQSIRLNRFVKPKENAACNQSVPLQFSMPVQCTDEPNEEGTVMLKPKGPEDKLSFAPIMPRGLGPDDEVSVSVESLSNLSVKFPPSSDESEFLQSTPENEPVRKPIGNVNARVDNFHKEALFFPKQFTGAHCVSSGTEPLQGAASNQENYKYLHLGNDYEGSSEEDNSLCLPGISPTRKYNQDAGSGAEPLDANERIVRGPQQDIWMPFPRGENILSTDSEKEDRNSSEICEFCQAVFPPSSRSERDFLRHLNSHFYGQS